MPIQLSPAELRVIACLIEKQVTTPEQYPLSLNALHSACNQKSNRDPVMDLSETEIQAALDSLSRRHLVLERSGFGSRVPKYQQRLCNTEFSTLQLSPQERALLCELMLRGPQTAGELRSRAVRMASFVDAAEVEGILEALARRAEGPLVRRLAREAGRREVRYGHLLGLPTPEPAEAPAPERAGPDGAVAATGGGGADTAGAAAGAPAEASATAGSVHSRLRALEEAVARLTAQVEALRRAQ